MGDGRQDKMIDGGEEAKAGQPTNLFLVGDGATGVFPSPRGTDPLARNPASRHDARGRGSSSRSSLTKIHTYTQVYLRELHREETAREIANLPKVPQRFLQTGSPASVLIAAGAPAVDRTPASRTRSVSAAAVRDNKSIRDRSIAAATTTSRPRSVAHHRSPGRDALLLTTQQEQGGQYQEPAISRYRARPRAQTSVPSSSTATKLPIPSSARDSMDFFDSQRVSVDAAPFKRRSLSTDLDNLLDRRPSTSGSAYARPSSRLNTNRSADLQRHMDQYRYRSPTNRSTYGPGDSASVVSGYSTSSRAAQRYSAAPEISPLSPSRLRERLGSPETSDSRRRRPSFGPPMPSASQNNRSHTLDTSEESPVEESQPKQSESTSTESQQDDHVWDELDDLKSRIKELEMKDKVPTVSSATASGDSSERPRTATTAPTTIDSSPKHERKRDAEGPKATPTPPNESDAGANSLSNIHPSLHTALAKAQTLLNASLYRTLEATAKDALQLAALTGNSSSYGNNYSSASIINGAPVNDRHVRRKVDNMCRNLTELCIALCDGKNEAPDVLSSPTSIGTARQKSPSLRYSEDRPLSRAPSNKRPMSRLEVRRSSILGANSLVPYESISPQSSYADISATEEQEPTSAKSIHFQGRRISRGPNELRSRIQHQDDSYRDEGTNIRPPSRAMTDVGAMRTRSRVASEARSPVAQRTPSLREVLASKRKNEGAYESNHEISRVSSFGSDQRRRRLFDQQSTPPVLEEDVGPDNYYTPSQLPRRRVTSLASPSDRQYTRKSIGEIPSRTPSLNQRRHIITE